MRLQQTLLLGAATATGLAFPQASHWFAERAACAGNTADDRSVWCDYSTSTNYYDEVPDTGVTREYWLDITAATVAPDGVPRYGLLVNGTSPGPTIFADWGDYVIVHVTNSLTDATSPVNGTSMHFHGIRQNYTNQMDGAAGITQCPTAQGDTITYEWRATQYGSTWYHSHFSMQPWNGFYGGIVINGPSTANYDVDLGMLFLTDWSYQTANQKLWEALYIAPPSQDTGLINGTNVSGANSTQLGYYFNTTFTAGTSYRIRLVNTAMDTYFKFMIDNHTLTVMTTDLVPIVPYETDVLNIAMGTMPLFLIKLVINCVTIAQRYDLVVTADQESVADNFWLRAIPQTPCSDNLTPDGIKGIVSYSNSTVGIPTTTAYAYTEACEDETASDLVPYLALDASTPTWTETEDAAAGISTSGPTTGLNVWFLNDTSFRTLWDAPSLLDVLYNGTFTNQSDVIVLDEASDWNYLVIYTLNGATHPMHLHGHDFYIVAQGAGTFNSSVALNTVNPPRRDTASLVADGYLVIAWPTDNPGVWLAHCHIGTHTEQGLALQFLERASEIPGITNSSFVTNNCNNWDAYMTANDYTQGTDDGI